MTSPTRPADLSHAAFRSRAGRGLLARPSEAIFDPRTGRSWGASDFDLNPELAADLAVMDPPRPAAVLVGVVAREPLTVLLTQRTEHLPTHGGQIAFPGGRVDAGDISPVAAALREAEEEVGLAADYIEPLGYLDSYRTGTGFHIMPVVALIRPGFSLKLNEGEVSEAFEVPLDFVMNPSNVQRHTRPWRGRERAYYAIPYADRYIWGATAGILKNMHERLFAP
jgi:8-oxo-dGTP pyrophosphatase MutT (NUDIX family)